MENLLALNFENDILYLNKDNISKKGNYYILDDYFELSSKKALHIVGIFDLNFQNIVPVLKNEVLKSDVLKNNVQPHIMFFKEDKVIYNDYDNCYLIDLKKVKTKNNEILNYEDKFLGFYRIDDDKIIIYKENESYIYDVIDNKKCSNTYNYIQHDEQLKKLFHAYYYLDNKYLNPLCVHLIINSNNEIHNEILINEELQLTLSNELLKDEEEIKKYSDEAFNDYFAMLEGKKLCKRKYIQ